MKASAAATIRWTHCFMFCFFPVHGEGEGEREGEVRAWYDRRSLSVRSDAKTVNGMLETGDAILSAKDKPDFGRPGPFNFFLL